MLTLGGMGFHYKAPRRLKKDLAREQLLDRVHEIEEILVDLGHMKKKRVVVKKKQKRFMGKKNKKGMKVQKKDRDIEEAIEEDEDDEEE